MVCSPPPPARRQSWPRPTKWMWRCYLRRAAAPPSCAAWCPRSSRNWYEWSPGFMNPLSTSIPRCKAVSNRGKSAVCCLLPETDCQKGHNETKRSEASRLLHPGILALCQRLAKPTKCIVCLQHLPHMFACLTATPLRRPLAHN